MKISKVNLIVVFVLVALSGQAQSDFYNGYVVKNSGDTLRGLIQVNNEIVNHSECFFKEDSNSETIRYLPGELTGYGFESGNSYVTKMVSVSRFNNKLFFLNRIESGRMSIYKLVSPLGNVRFFVEKSTIKGFYELLQDRYSFIGILKWLMADCNIILETIDEAEFDESSLTYLVRVYNQCSDYTESAQITLPAKITSVEREEFSFSWNYGARAGISFNQVNFMSARAAEFKYLDSLTVENNSSLTMGIFGRLMPTPAKWLALDVSIRYAQQNFTGNNTTTLPSGNSIHQYASLQFKTLKIPIEIRLNPFHARSFDASISFGMMNSIFFESFNHQITEREVGSIIYISQSEVFPFRSYELGFIAGIEFRYKLTEDKAIGLEFSYQTLGGIDKVIGEDLSKIRSLDISASFQFIK